MADKPPLTVSCPHCRGPALYHPDNRWRPFCSERCRQADLGAWASEQFRVPGAPAPDALGEAGLHGSSDGPARGSGSGSH